jgi:hypothetical protein
MMQQSQVTSGSPVIFQWSFWSFLGIAFFLAVDVATNMLDFPLRLLLLQVEVWLAERVWRNRRTLPEYDPAHGEYAAA